jgi:hypothetical protein
MSQCAGIGVDVLLSSPPSLVAAGAVLLQAATAVAVIATVNKATNPLCPQPRNKRAAVEFMLVQQDCSQAPKPVKRGGLVG